jgi:hypothetical protein
MLRDLATIHANAALEADTQGVHLAGDGHVVQQGFATPQCRLLTSSAHVRIATIAGLANPASTSLATGHRDDGDRPVPSNPA